MSTIVSIDVRRFEVPLAEVLVDAKHGAHTHFELVTVSIRDADGTEGTGYTYTGGKGGTAIQAMIENDLKPFLLDREAAAVEDLFDAMQWHIHYVARGGIASFAISAVDIALWDLRGKTTGEPLWKMAGNADQSCRAYRGGIDLNFPLPKLLDSIRGYLDEGFNGVKIKIGQPTLAEDVERIAKVRDLIGPDVTFLVDANYSYEVDQAIDKRKGVIEDELLAETDLGRQILKLRHERESLLDAIWLDTSPKQVKDLWSKVADLLGDEPTQLERDALAIPPVGDD